MAFAQSLAAEKQADDLSRPKEEVEAEKREQEQGMYAQMAAQESLQKATLPAQRYASKMEALMTSREAPGGGPADLRGAEGARGQDQLRLGGLQGPHPARPHAPRLRPGAL